MPINLTAYPLITRHSPALDASEIVRPTTEESRWIEIVGVEGDASQLISATYSIGRTSQPTGYGANALWIAFVAGMWVELVIALVVHKFVMERK